MLEDTCACRSMCKYVMLFEDRKKSKNMHFYKTSTLCDHIVQLQTDVHSVKPHNSLDYYVIVCCTEMIALFVESLRTFQPTFKALNASWLSSDRGIVSAFLLPHF